VTPFNNKQVESVLPYLLAGLVPPVMIGDGPVVTSSVGSGLGPQMLGYVAPNGTASHTLSAATGSFALTGESATLGAAVACADGSFALTGKAATLGAAAACADGSFALAGEAATLGAAIACAGGSFVLTGEAATLTFVSAHGLSSAAGSFSLTGENAVLGVSLSTAAGSFALTGEAATLGAAVACADGSFSLAGGAAALSYTPSGVLDAAAGFFTLTGENAALTFVSFTVEALEDLLSDAIVAELNDPARPWHGQFQTESCTAFRTRFPVYKDTDLVGVKIAVVPLTLARQRAARTRRQLDFGIAIDLQRRIEPTDDPTLKSFSLLAQQIHDFFDDGHLLATMNTWACIETDRPDIYSMERLYTEAVWETLLNVKVRGFKP
jgi:hypothetical protein